MLQVANLIRYLCPDSYPDRDPKDLEYIVIHRVGWVDESEWAGRGLTRDATGVRDFYRDEVGLSMPYTFTVALGGLVEQARLLLDTSPHAARFNEAAIGVGFLGDFRFAPPEKHQWIAGVDLCAMLLRAWPHLQVVGHDELGPGSTSTPGKVCPGPLFNMEAFRREASMVAYNKGVRDLKDIGVVL